MLSVLRLARNRLVVADEWVQVAVAGMEHVANAEAGRRFELSNPTQNLGQLRTRDDPILDVVVWRDATHRRECRFSSFPDPLPIGCVLRDLHGRRPRLAT